jgi:hypothetical protein
MKMLVAGVAFAALVSSPAFAQSYDPSVGSGNIVQWSYSTTDTGVPAPGHSAFARVAPGRAASPYSANAAVTPFGSPAGSQNSGNHTKAAREKALSECSLVSRRYAQTTWGNMDGYQHRTCMAQHGQME